MNELYSRKDEIEGKITRHTREFLEKFGHVSSFSSQLVTRLTDFALRGKHIRGSLVPFTYALLPGREVSFDAITDVAAALEILQSMLLIHDDIMDQDELRRGKAAIHALYMNDGRTLGVTDPAHYGESLGICAGDVATFLAMRIVASMEADDGLVRSVERFIADELMLVGLSQMQDVHHGQIDGSMVGYDDIIRTYRYKTGRYTFSLPMSLAGLLRGSSHDIRQILEKTGELIGIIFQIKDDELGLFGNPESTGKPNDSDLREGKKTVYVQLLRDLLKDEQRKKLDRILQEYRGPADQEWVLDLMNTHGIREQVEADLLRYRKEIDDILSSLPEEVAELRQGLEKLTDYNMSRSR
ncbi:polyprenyl synthetase family protein [Salinispira pacifica]|uniref:Geranylgeranyl diphosphate synthase n=1 Tax=Salinispira pacifica TaxID=1307761 RepID=V5WHI3_9SPIO|nr:polyprenyl synthetase family protein [Salinispira pacifica]AHC15273.1 Geranylgeranyl diphosphate synthase [Salinispira pacifica]